MIPVPIIDDVSMSDTGVCWVLVWGEFNRPLSIKYRMVDNDPTRLEPAE